MRGIYNLISKNTMPHHKPTKVDRIKTFENFTRPKCREKTDKKKLSEERGK